MKVLIHSDASVCTERELATWAIWVQGPSFVLKHTGKCNLETVTSQQAELYAAVMGIKYALDFGAISVTCITDCMCVIHALHYKKPGHPLTLQMVEWMSFLNFPEKFTLKAAHVKSHTGRKDRDSKRNAWCDTAARGLLRKLR